MKHYSIFRLSSFSFLEVTKVYFYCFDGKANKMISLFLMIIVCSVFP